MFEGGLEAKRTEEAENSQNRCQAAVASAAVSAAVGHRCQLFGSGTAAVSFQFVPLRDRCGHGSGTGSGRDGSW